MNVVGKMAAEDAEDAEVGGEDRGVRDVRGSLGRSLDPCVVADVIAVVELERRYEPRRRRV
jgi:hypothetical protein